MTEPLWLSEGIEMNENNFIAKKTYSITAKFKDSEYYCTVYGLKTADNTLSHALKLVDTGLFSSIYYTRTWKETRYGRWHKEDFQVHNPLQKGL